MIKRFDKLNEAMTKYLNKVNSVAKSKRTYNTKDELHSPQIHLVDLIYNHPDCNTTELSNILGVTKMAVSKTAKSIEKMGYIERYQINDNRKEIYYKLTDLGLTAYKGHIQFHENQDYAVYKRWENLSDEQLQFLIDFFNNYSDDIDKLYKKKNKG